MYNQIAGQKTARTEALSDGVFSIAMTLLVLDLKVPVAEAIHDEASLLHQLFALGPRFLTYFASFMTLGIFWTGQSTQFNYIERGDRRITWLSMLFLLFVSLVPFTTAFLSEHIHFKLAIGLYWLNILAMGAALYVHWLCAYENGYIRADAGEKQNIDRAIRRRIIKAQALYACGALLCFVNTYLSICVIILIQLNYVLDFFGNSKRKQDAAADGTA